MREMTAFPPSRQALAWSVHLFTALGAVFAALALLSIRAGEFHAAAIYMIVALVIDAVDGTFARAVGVSEVLPDVDGRRLDDMVDYLNFVIVPVVFIAALGALPAWGFIAFPILASAYGFSQAAAKTDDDFFLGWPSYWNIVAFYVLLLELSVTATTLWVLGLSFAIFLPLKYVYPSKLAQPFFRHTLNWGGLVWAAVLVAALASPETSERFHLVEASLGYLVYYMVLSVWLGKWKDGWA